MPNIERPPLNTSSVVGGLGQHAGMAIGDAGDERRQRDALGERGQKAHRRVALEEGILGGPKFSIWKKWSARVNMSTPPSSAADGRGERRRQLLGAPGRKSM